MSNAKNCNVYKASNNKMLNCEGNLNLCIFCYEFCYGIKKNLSPKILCFPTRVVCECDHVENGKLLDDGVLTFFKEAKEGRINSIYALNILFQYEKNIIEYIDPEVYSRFIDDNESVLGGSFRWEDVEVNTVQGRFDFINPFFVDIPQYCLNILNPVPIFQSFSLNFLNRFFDKPNYYYGTPVYNRSLDYYSALLEFFIQYYLQRDLVGMDKIEADEIETLSPITRVEIRSKNLRQKELNEKYFNSEFNIFTFVLNIMDKFIPGASWRFIGGKHKCHYLSIKVAKILCEYGLLSDLQIDEILNLLYLKIPVFLRLEELVEADSERISHTWINIWADGFKEVRQYYIEILIHQVYLKQDNEVLKMIENLSIKPGELFSLKQAEKTIDFQKTVLFEQEFGKKVLDFLLGFILCQNTILGKVLTTDKTILIAMNFLYIFSNTNDPYLTSLKLLDQKTIQDFLEKKGQFVANPKIENFIRKLNTLKRETEECVYIYEEDKALDQLLKLIDEIFLYLQTDMKKIQMQIQSTDIVSKTMNLLMIYKAKIIASRKDVMDKILFFLREFLRNNAEGHCMFFQTHNMENLDKFIDNYPLEISQFINQNMQENIFVAIIDEGQYQQVLNFIDINFSNLLKELEHPDCKIKYCQEYYSALECLFETTKHFLDKKNQKKLHYMPEFDMKLSKNILEKLQKIDIVLLQKGINNITSLTEKEAFYFKLYIMILENLRNSINQRFTYQIYEALVQLFPVEQLLNLTKECNDKLNFRNLFLEFIDILYMDPMNELLFDRQKLIGIENYDPYDEKQFFDCQYKLIIPFFEQEILNIVKLFSQGNIDIKNDKNFFNYTHQQVICSIAKLVSYFSLSRPQQVQDLSHLIPYLSKLRITIFENIGILNKIFEIQSSQNIEQTNEIVKESKLQELELAANNDSSTRIQRMQIKQSCTEIYELCTLLVKDKELTKDKTNRVADINFKDLIIKTTRVIKGFSNKMEARKELLEYNSQNEEKYNIVDLIIKMYENYKMEKLSIKKDENVYISPLNENSKENQRFCYNLCVFFINQLLNEWKPYEMNYIYSLVECLCNCLFISTKSLQQNFYKALIKKGTDNEVDYNVLDKIWYHMLDLINFTKNKTSIDKVWKIMFQRALLFIKFHQYLCEDVNETFKLIFGQGQLPDQQNATNRVNRTFELAEGIIQKYGWHSDYENEQFTRFTRSQKPHLIPMTIYLFDLLEELVSGPCLVNQTIVYQKGYDVLNGILNRYVVDINSEFYRLKEAVLGYILSIIEGFDQTIVTFQTTRIELSKLNEIMINSVVQLFAQTYNQQQLENIKSFKSEFKDYQALKRQYDSNPEFYNHVLLEIAVKIYTYIKQLSGQKLKYLSFCEERLDSVNEYKEKGKYSKEFLNEEDLVIFRFLSSIVSKVEIQNDRNKLEDLYFMVPSKCIYLTDKTKNKFLKEVDRKDPGTKIVGLTNRIRFFDAEMTHNHKVYAKNARLYKIVGPKNLIFLQGIIFLLWFVINVLLLINLKSQKGDRDIYEGKYKYQVNTLAWVILALASGSLVFWLYTQKRLIQLIETEEYKVIHSKQNLSVLEILYITFYKSLLAKGDCFVSIFHIVCALLGIFISPGFFGLALLAIVNISETLQLLVKSTTAHLSQLISTYILGLIVMYSYSLFTHLYFVIGFQDNTGNLVYRDNQAKQPETLCDSLMHCFISIINISFSNNQGVGDMISAKESFQDNNLSFFYARLIFEISFFLLINTILINILMGIVIDTFRELREKNNIINSENTCFICGLEAYVFQKHGLSFGQHAEIDHNIWNYTNFLVYMKQKTLKDCNGVQGYIYQKISKNQNDWLPQLRSGKLEKKKAIKETNVNYENLCNGLKKMKKDISSLLGE